MPPARTDCDEVEVEEFMQDLEEDLEMRADQPLQDHEAIARAEQRAKMLSAQVVSSGADGDEGHGGRTSSPYDEALPIPKTICCAFFAGKELGIDTTRRHRAQRFASFHWGGDESSLPRRR